METTLFANGNAQREFMASEERRKQKGIEIAACREIDIHRAFKSFKEPLKTYEEIQAFRLCSMHD